MPPKKTQTKKKEKGKSKKKGSVKKLSVLEKEERKLKRGRLALPSHPINDLIRKIVSQVATGQNQLPGDVRFTKGALLSLHEAFEAYIVSLLEDANKIRAATMPINHRFQEGAKRKDQPARITVCGRDILTALQIRNEKFASDTLTQALLGSE